MNKFIWSKSTSYNQYEYRNENGFAMADIIDGYTERGFWDIYLTLPKDDFWVDENNRIRPRFLEVKFRYVKGIKLAKDIVEYVEKNFNCKQIEYMLEDQHMNEVLLKEYIIKKVS
jgi:hypothetical protein